MKVLIGLGNPGKQYEKTRHNVGFMVLDKVAKHYGQTITTKKFNSFIAEFFVNQEKVVLVKPQTYMNLSGDAVRSLMEYYRIDESDIFVIYDDLDLAVGGLRLRDKGSSGGQNGIKDIINKVGTQEFKRLRIGIDNNKQIPRADYVLGRYDEKNTAIDDAVHCAIDYLEGIDFVNLSNTYNKK